MNREGHVEAALALYAPVGFFMKVSGFPSLAMVGAIGAVALAMLPDQDIRIPVVFHRGITHTIWFALLVAGVLGLAGAFLGREKGVAGGIWVGIFAAVVGFVTIVSHIAADAITPMGVNLLPRSRTGRTPSPSPPPRIPLPTTSSWFWVADWRSGRSSSHRPCGSEDRIAHTLPQPVVIRFQVVVVHLGAQNR